MTVAALPSAAASGRSPGPPSMRKTSAAAAAWESSQRPTPSGPPPPVPSPQSASSSSLRRPSQEGRSRKCPSRDRCWDRTRKRTRRRTPPPGPPWGRSRRRRSRGWIGHPQACHSMALPPMSLGCRGGTRVLTAEAVIKKKICWRATKFSRVTLITFGGGLLSRWLERFATLGGDFLRGGAFGLCILCN